MTGRDGILRVLPHRYPMLLLDSIVAFEPGRRLVATKSVTVAEPCYRRVAPGSDLAYPRALILESFGQAGAVLCLWEREVSRDRPIFAAVRECSFEADVFPGETMEHRVALDRELDDSRFLSGDTWVGGRRVMRVDWLLTVVRPVPGST